MLPDKNILPEFKPELLDDISPDKMHQEFRAFLNCSKLNELFKGFHELLDACDRKSVYEQAKKIQENALGLLCQESQVSRAFQFYEDGTLPLDTDAFSIVAQFLGEDNPVYEAAKQEMSGVVIPCKYSKRSMEEYQSKIEAIAKCHKEQASKAVELVFDEEALPPHNALMIFALQNPLLMAGVVGLIVAATLFVPAVALGAASVVTSAALGGGGAMFAGAATFFSLRHNERVHIDADELDREALSLKIAKFWVYGNCKGYW